MLIEYLLNFKNVSCRTNERMCDEVNIFLDCQQDVCLVFLCQCRKLYMLARNIHTLTRTKLAIVLYLRYQHRSNTLYNEHIQRTIVKEYMVANLYITSKVGIRHIDHILCRVNIRTTKEFHHVTCLILNRLCHSRSSHLWPFRVNQQC